MRILFATCSPAGYMAPPRLGDEQVNCGPDWPDRDIDGHVFSLNTSAGQYDLAALAARLPAEQQPDAVVCLVDASWRSMPRNLQAFKCPKILLVADTHHLNEPIAGMIRYAKSEPYDRIVLLYDRHHWEFFAAAGLQNLHWFPGLTFPHADDVVRAARCPGEPANRIAFVGQLGICHPRRIRLLSHLHAHRLPVAVKALPQREALAFYGASLVGFNASLNGDFNLRVFEIVASGALLLTDTLTPASGLAELFQPGAEFLSYGSPAELAEHAQHAMARPAEARAIATAATRRFDALFADAARRRALRALVVDGVSRPEFALPSARTFSAGPAEPRRFARFTTGFEHIQELHRNLDQVVVALDEGVPTEFAQMCATLPRLEVRRGLPEKDGRTDFAAISRVNYQSSNLVRAANVWPWENAAAEQVALARRCSSMGLVRANAEQQVFSRQRVNTHRDDGAVALVRLEQGGYDDALYLARKELEKNPRSVDALFVVLELAQEKGHQPVVQSALARLRVLAPHHPRLQEIMADSPETIQKRRVTRLLRVARAQLEQGNAADSAKTAREALALDAKSADAHFVLGCIAARSDDEGSAASMFAHATYLAPDKIEYWQELGRMLRKVGRVADALGAWIHLAALDPANLEYQLALGSTALAAGHGAIAVGAFEAALRLQPGLAAARRGLARARELHAACDYGRPRDLLLSHVEVTRLQGTGVLIERFFPDARDFITVRSRTLYQGRVHFGGTHFSLDLPGLSEGARRAVLQRLLAPYTIRRILAVPFFATDFMHAATARELTGAPLCTYAMDDQVLHAREVPAELARRVFALSEVRLAISPEMAAEYAAWFRCSFGLLPPIVTTNDNEAPNAWTESAGSNRHCVMVGNIWSAKQFEQLRTFTRAAGLRVDWFGNAKVAWLPQNQEELARDGIHPLGFLPEDQLARRLADYPFVLLPSGTLDGTEDNEWLTRLSLPSRMVFILTKTFTPMLVLGSPRTAAAHFVDQFGLGASSNYDADEAREVIERITQPARRAQLLENARRLAPGFLMPGCGEWIWRSLAARRAEPTPFDRLYESVRDEWTGDETPPSAPAGAGNAAAEPASFEERLAAIGPRLADAGFLDSFLPPDEPRQRRGEDLRGAVRYLRQELAAFGSRRAALLAVERLARQLPNRRAVLVAWAELLEEAGETKEAASKARQALAVFYDDVYTQTLFVRCGGVPNYHADARDRFCPHPFENFEVFKDGSVFACNCTQMPFPIGNAFRQTAAEIWQSPPARALRASILDGSFRFCSPMTCYRRFNLPRRSEESARFAELQASGVAGLQGPKHFNLSYDLSCGLSCPSCRNAQIMATHEERQQLDHIRDHIVLPLLADKIAESVYITGSGDAFGSPHFRGVLKQLCEPEFSHVQITLGTNGQLLTERLWADLAPLHRRFRDITVSIDGAVPETYERLRRGSRWEKLLRTMAILSGARRAGAIPRIMVNMVVQQQNFLEMRPLLALCKGWAVDGVRFYRIRQWGHVAPAIFMASDIVNPLHPRHQELLAELAHPAFADPIVDRYDMYELIEQVQRARNPVLAVA
jgi:tetratricopeptide (TPR) repeat protein